MPRTIGTYDDEVGSSRSKRSRQHETVEEVLLPQFHHEFLPWEGCNRDAKSRLREAGSDEETFTSVAWIRAFNINEPIYAELCHKFYSTYEFDKVCADDELQTKKIIKFRLGGRVLVKLSREENLGLSRSHTSTIKSLILKVIHKMITYGSCQRTTGWMKRKEAGTQKESQICCGKFISKIAKKCMVLTEDVVRSLSALIYCRDLDTTTLSDLIDSESKLILEDPQPRVPIVGIPRPPRASMYQEVFEHMAGDYSVSLRGAFNPSGYALP
nr:hypothetical protein [Tanacetum cinerariifolium]